MLLYIRSALFAVLLPVTTMLYSVVCLLFFYFLPFRQRYAAVVLVNRFILVMARLICGIKVEIKGLENLPAKGGYVIAANHQSEWETFFLQTLVGPLCTVLKQELLKIPFFGWALKMLRPIAIDRSARTGALKQLLKQGRERLEQGIPVLVFPQGTRVKVGEVGRFNKGGAMLACSAGVPLVPIVHNGGHYWPSKQMLKYPGTIRLEIGAPIETTGRSVNEVHEQSVRWLEEGLQRVDQAPS